MKIKALIKEFIPPIIWRLRKRQIGVDSLPLADLASENSESRFVGDYSSWEEALRDSTGYDSQVILDKTLDSILKVKNGQAVFERDSALLDRAEYPFFLIASLLHIAALNNGKLSVLDFGGSLGSSYFQCHKFLEPIKSLRWSVVEQRKHVEYGRKYVEDDVLRFYYTIDECLKHETPHVVVLSGVIFVVEQPYELIESVIATQFEYAIVDRQLFNCIERDRLCVLHVSPNIYRASFPLWFLNEKRFRDAWLDSYNLEVESDEAAFIVDGSIMPNKQFFYSRKTE